MHHFLGLKALRCKMSMDYIEQLLKEAIMYYYKFRFNRLQIEKEKLFADVSEVKAIAGCWAERARRVLICNEEMSEFEDVIRASEDVLEILPSLDEVKDAVSIATCWLSRSQPFLLRDSTSFGSSPSLEVRTLKELASESKVLKLSLKEQLMIQELVDTCTRWEQDACSVLLDTERLWNVENMDDEKLSSSSSRLGEIEKQIQAMDSVVAAGQGLGFKFNMVPKLQDACAILHWCFRALSFATAIPTLEEVKRNVEIAAHLPIIALTDWVNWLMRAIEVSAQSTLRRSKLSDAEEVLDQYPVLSHPSSLALSRTFTPHLLQRLVGFRGLLRSTTHGWIRCTYFSPSTLGIDHGIYCCCLRNKGLMMPSVAQN